MKQLKNTAQFKRLPYHAKRYALKHGVLPHVVSKEWKEKILLLSGHGHWFTKITCEYMPAMLGVMRSEFKWMLTTSLGLPPGPCDTFTPTLWVKGTEGTK